MNKNYLFIASLAFLLFVGQVSSQDHLWTFDEGTGYISYDKGTSRNSVNAILNNAQWRDLSKVGPGAAVHITGADNSYVSFGNNVRGGNNGGNNFPNNDGSDSDSDDRNNSHDHDNNNGGNNFPRSNNNNNINHNNGNNNGGVGNNNNNGGNNFPGGNNNNNNNRDNGNNMRGGNNNNNRGNNFPNNDDSDSDSDGGNNFPGGNNNNRNNRNAVGQFGTQDFTVAFWFQTTDTSLALADLIGNRAASGHGNFFAVRITNDGYVSAEVDQDAAGTNYIGFRSRQNRLNDGNWHQVVVTRSGRTLTLYIDGSLSNSGTGAGVANINNGVVFKIGRSMVDNRTPRFSLDATFDDVAIYSSALSASQVRTLYSGATNQ